MWGCDDFDMGSEEPYYPDFTDVEPDEPYYPDLTDVEPDEPYYPDLTDVEPDEPYYPDFTDVEPEAYWGASLPGKRATLVSYPVRTLKPVKSFVAPNNPANKGSRKVESRSKNYQLVALNSGQSMQRTGAPSKPEGSNTSSEASATTKSVNLGPLKLECTKKKATALLSGYGPSAFHRAPAPDADAGLALAEAEAEAEAVRRELSGCRVC